MIPVTGDAGGGGNLPQGAASGFLSRLRYYDNGGVARSVDTMRAGFTLPQVHIDAVRNFNFREVLR